jgi:elongation factor P--(R)-beta-lysine ligase
MAGGERWWHADAMTRRAANLRVRGAVLDATRTFFRDCDFTEVETPALQISPGLEPHLRPFATALADPLGEEDRAMYLHTSPEYAMKKLLAAGIARPYQLAHVFRNAERGALHHPEFAMLEWYRADESYEAIMADCLALLAAVAPAALRHGALACDARAPHERLTVADAFARHAGIDLPATEGDGDHLAAEAWRIGVDPGATRDWEDVFFKIFLDRIEPLLGHPAPTLLTEYPARMAALARLKPGDPRVAERFELYVCGVELANGFSELIDPAEQRRRFAADRARRRALYGGEGPPIDEDFLAALATMPPAAGVALGFDRLVMLAAGAARIEDVLWAPVDPG